MSMLAALALLCTLQETVRDVRTEHYDLHAETADPRDVGAMLEQLHRHLTRHFGKAPAERLRVEVYATHGLWVKALAADGIEAPKAGGYYSPGTRKATLFVQPSEHYTRQLILHEATHQFHLLAATGNKSPGTLWYEEGLAEYFGMHTWDGRDLKVGVVPAITLEDYPARALKDLDSLGGNLEGMIAGTTVVERPLAWSFVHFLLHNRAKEFAALAARLDCQEKALDAWKSAFGPVKAELAAQLREWIAKHQQPWKIAWVAWQERDGAIEGRAEDSTVGLAIHKTAKRLRAAVEPCEGAFKAGLVFGFVSTDDFWMAQILPERRARVMHRIGKRWETAAEMEYPVSGEGAVLAATPGQGGVAVTVNGKSLGCFDASGDFGLNVEDCRALFRIRD